MNERKLFKRPNNDQMLAAPAQTTGGLKGIIAGLNINLVICRTFHVFLYVFIKITKEA
jgi:hypothetical protein